MTPTTVATSRLELLARKICDKVRDLTFERVNIAANCSEVVADLDKSCPRFLELLLRRSLPRVGIADYSTRVRLDLDASFDGQQPHRFAHRVGCRAEHHRQFAIARKLLVYRVFP